MDLKSLKVLYMVSTSSPILSCLFHGIDSRFVTITDTYFSSSKRVCLVRLDIFFPKQSTPNHGIADIFIEKKFNCMIIFPQIPEHHQSSASVFSDGDNTAEDANAVSDDERVK